MSKQAFVVRRKVDGFFYKTASKVRWDPKLSRQELNAKNANAHWSPDLQAARTYTNRGGAKSCIPYRADEAEYEFLPVKLVIDA